MKLLIVTGIFPPDPGGPASSVPRIAEALSHRGHRVKVICLSDHVDHDDRAYPFAVRRIRRGLFWPWRVVATAFTIWLAAWRNDLLYVNGLGAESALAALLAGRRTVHKVVGDYAWERAVGRGIFRGTLEEYQTTTKSLALRVFDAIRTLPMRLAARIIVPSRYLQRVVEGWDIPAEKVRVIYNATPGVENANPTSGKRLPEWSGRTLITVCRLVRWKRVDALIRLLLELPDTRLVVAGDGHLGGEWVELARTIGVGERVIFLGDVPHREVCSYLQQADAFVLNSSYEGLPHVVLEAMAAGVPVIATDAGGTREVVAHEMTGLLIPVNDAPALKAAIMRLAGDPPFARYLTVEAGRQLSERFDFEKMVADTEAELLAAIEPADQPHPLRAKDSP